MSLTLDTLTLLEAIDRRGSFARAAEELGRATSSLTYEVQQLEAALDVLIFDRTGHSRAPIWLAWRSGETGRALDWFVRALSAPRLFQGILDD